MNGFFTSESNPEHRVFGSLEIGYWLTRWPDDDRAVCLPRSQAVGDDESSIHR